MFDIQNEVLEWGGKKLTIETGRIARQAHGSVIATYGGTSVLATVVADREEKKDIDFFPLTVNYQEKAYAAGKIPGGFFKREGRPSEKETLVSRLIDRPEFKTKPKPVTFFAENRVSDAVSVMSEKNYGSVIIVDKQEKVIGVVTERDIVKKLVNAGLSPKNTKLEKIMTKNPRVANENDKVIDMQEYAKQKWKKKLN